MSTTIIRVIDITISINITVVIDNTISITITRVIDITRVLAKIKILYQPSYYHHY